MFSEVIVMNAFLSACAVDNCHMCTSDVATCQVCDVGYTMEDSASSGKYKSNQLYPRLAALS